MSYLTSVSRSTQVGATHAVPVGSGSAGRAQEPINGGAIHQGWEAPCAAPKAITHGREAERHVKVLT